MNLETVWSGSSWRDIPQPVIDQTLPDYSHLNGGPRRAPRGSVPAIVYAALTRPTTVVTLMDKTGLTKNQVASAVWELIKKRRIRVLADRVHRKAVYERIA